MAKHFFVRGPSVNPNIGSPAQFIESIQKTIQGFGDRRAAEDKAAALKIFRDQTIDQENRRQDFTEGATERARAEKLFTREQDNKRAIESLSIRDSSGGSFKAPFLANPETQAAFAQFGITDTAQQSKVVDQLAKDNKSLFNDPTKLGDEIYRKELKAGKSQLEAEAARTAAINESFSTLPSELAKALLIKQSTGGSGKNSIFGSSKKSGGSTTPLSGIPNQVQISGLTEQFVKDFDIEGGRIEIAGFRPFDRRDHDLTEGDIQGLIGNFATELRPETVLRTLGALTNASDGTTKFDPRKFTGPQRADFLKLGQQIELKANEARGSGGIFGNASLSDIQALEKSRFDRTNTFNQDILGRTSAQPADFASRLAALVASQGGLPPQIDPRQGGNQGGTPVVAPEIVTPPQEISGGTGSTGLDQLLSPATATPNKAEFQLGGQIPAERLFDQAKNTVGAVTTAPIRAIGKLFESLTLPTGGVLSENTSPKNSPPGTLRGNQQTDFKNSPIFKQIQIQQRIQEIQSEISNMPPSIAQTQAQKNQVKKLEKELLELQ